MKKNLLIFLIGISFVKFNAQQIAFCPPGAEWHYLFTDYFPTSGYVNETIKYASNVKEGNDTLKLLTHTKFFTMVNTSPTYTTLIKQKGDTVFMKNVKTNNQWQILYNFAAQVNQSWTNTFYLWPNVTITYTTQVTSIGSKQIGNNTVKELSVNYSNSYGSSYNHSGTISEYFGSNAFLFNYVSLDASDGDYYISFLCYTDNTIGTTQFTDKPCNFSNLTGVNEVSDSVHGISVFPNPTTNKIYLNFKPELVNIQLSLYNSTGQIIYSANNILENHEIDLSLFDNGIYFLRLKNYSEQKVIKLIKD